MKSKRVTIPIICMIVVICIYTIAVIVARKNKQITEMPSTFAPATVTTVAKTTKTKENSTTTEIKNTTVFETVSETEIETETETEIEYETEYTDEENLEETLEVNEDLISLGEFRLTAYCNCSICCGKWAGGATASGVMPASNRTIAVDTDVVPFGTEVIIDGDTYVAEDTGSAIIGNRIDIYMDSHQSALNFGVQYAEVFIKS